MAKYIRSSMFLLLLAFQLAFSQEPPIESGITEHDWYLCEKFIKREAKSLFLQGITYIPAAPNHPYTIEQDPKKKIIFVHLKGNEHAYIGQGRYKLVTKSIEYGNILKIVARCQGHSTLDREAKILFKLKGTPGIVQIRSFIKHKHRDSELILEYYNKGPLQNLSTGRLQLSERDLLSIMKDLTIGLKSLHTAGYIHRDLHQGNVLLHQNDGFLKGALTDFGLACKINKNRNSRISVQDSVCAPEVLTTRPRYINRKKAEAYSLGVLFYYMLFNDRPTWWNIIKQYQPLTKEQKFHMHRTICALYQETIANGPPPQITGTGIRKDLTLLSYKLLNPNPKKRIYLGTALKEINAIARKWHIDLHTNKGKNLL